MIPIDSLTEFQKMMIIDATYAILFILWSYYIMFVEYIFCGWLSRVWKRFHILGN